MLFRSALKKKFREIAADEGVSGSCATESVTSAIRKLRKIFAKNGWLEKGAFDDGTSDESRAAVRKRKKAEKAAKKAAGKSLRGGRV